MHLPLPRLSLLLSLALSGCDAGGHAPALVAEAPAAVAPAPRAEPVAPAPAPTSAGTDPRLPVVGDPLGLLSKPAAASAANPTPSSRGDTPDPSALMAQEPARDPGHAALERDPRAVARGLPPLPARVLNPASSGAYKQVPVQDKSAREVVRRASQGGARVHVLLLYASYCPACRDVMPWFVRLARHYKARGVAFTAASIDRDRDAFTAYASVLEDALEPIWIPSEGVTRDELTRAGIRLPADTLKIPLFAVFAGQNRLVAQGNSAELRDLSRTLDALL